VRDGFVAEGWLDLPWRIAPAFPFRTNRRLGEANDNGLPTPCRHSQERKRLIQKDEFPGLDLD
jgi:hypothetical protein